MRGLCGLLFIFALAVASISAALETCSELSECSDDFKSTCQEMSEIFKQTFENRNLIASCSNGVCSCNIELVGAIPSSSSSSSAAAAEKAKGEQDKSG
ncbi:uncharacterized protein LOC106659587 [Trichogramma pretiosum]|uniref:uncharacterized protein LOC106659587 n=1 Tax=Trichogramma pretiosum TaxID=7493 RepID=UPI0006C94331|nr:uncharacterized protein LOC106659587 [Trichogramma pretiosum]